MLETPLFMELMTKLKEFEGDNIRSDFLLIAFDEASKINPNETNHHNNRSCTVFGVTCNG